MQSLSKIMAMRLNEPAGDFGTFYIFSNGMTKDSDFIWDFRKLPFASHLVNYFIKIGKISAKIQ